MNLLKEETMKMSDTVTTTKWLIWCIENELGFTAIGSRKVNQLTVEYVTEFGDEYSLRDSSGYTFFRDKAPDFITRFNITGSLAGYTMVTGKTELEALFFLLQILKEEERKEAEGKAALVARTEAWKKEQQKAKKKAKKKHDKAMKRILEGKFDAAKCPEDCVYCDEDLRDPEYWDE